MTEKELKILRMNILGGIATYSEAMKIDNFDKCEIDEEAIESYAENDMLFRLCVIGFSNAIRQQMVDEIADEMASFLSEMVNL